MEELVSVENQLKDAQGEFLKRILYILLLSVLTVGLSVWSYHFCIGAELFDLTHEHETAGKVCVIVIGSILSFIFGWGEALLSLFFLCDNVSKLIGANNKIKELNGKVAELKEIEAKRAAKRAEEEVKRAEREKKRKTCPQCGYHPITFSENSKVIHSNLSRNVEMAYKRSIPGVSGFDYSGADIINVQIVPQGGKLVEFTNIKECPNCGWKTSTSRQEEIWDGPDYDWKYVS